MYHILVVRNSVEGKVERVREDEVKIDGTAYDVVAGLTTYSINEDKDIALYNADKVADMAERKCSSNLDIAGI